MAIFINNINRKFVALGKTPKFVSFSTNQLITETPVAPISPSDFGTLLVDIDPANATLVSNKVSSISTGYGSYAFSQSVDANRPLYNVSDSSFNNKPSIQFTADDTWLSSNTITVGNAKLTFVVVMILSASNGAVIIGSTPDGNSVAKSLEMIHGGTNVRSFASGDDGATSQRNRNVSSTSAKLYYAIEKDFSIAGAAGHIHYENGVSQSTNVGFDGGTSGTPATASTWYVGHRGTGGWIFEGKIARILAYAGNVNQSDLYTNYLQPLYG